MQTEELGVVYLYIPTSNHNSKILSKLGLSLYIFIFLHQTTTGQYAKTNINELYIFIFLHQTTTQHRCPQMSDQLYIFIFLHQTTTVRERLSGGRCCISLYSYTKPQLREVCSLRHFRCISLYSYTKPQPFGVCAVAPARCISLYSYIKPQLLCRKGGLICVVYLYIPTSNHNLKKRIY